MSHPIYISGLLKDRFPEVYSDLLSAFKAIGVQGIELANTRDIWCRDYMPIRSANKDWVQFDFDPKYLKEGKYLNLKTDPDEVLNDLDLEYRRSSIKLEGGNFIRWGTHGVLTERVLEENPTYSTSQLIARIQEELGLDKVTIVPRQPYDYTGHVDGVVRFLNEEIVLIHDHSEAENDVFDTKLKAALKDIGLDWIIIPTSMYRSAHSASAEGMYLNYLKLEKAIILPVFGIKMDEQVVRLMESYFNECQIIPVRCEDLSKEGGAIHCVTWGQD